MPGHRVTPLLQCPMSPLATSPLGRASTAPNSGHLSTSISYWPGLPRLMFSTAPKTWGKRGSAMRDKEGTDVGQGWGLDMRADVESELGGLWEQIWGQS